MTSFPIHFILCNLFIALSILAIAAIKNLFRNHLSAGTIYHLWSVLFILMALPFLPMRFPEISHIFSWVLHPELLPEASQPTAVTPETITEVSQGWLKDFTISVTKKSPEVLGSIFLILWLTGIFFMLIFQIKALRKLSLMKRTAIPVCHPVIEQLYEQCCAELKIKKIPGLYETSLLKAPVMTGILHPGVYLPKHLISDFQEASQTDRITVSSELPLTSLRHILLHELTHYKQTDALINSLMNFFHLLYWPNPFVWFAVREIQNDREIACDTVVLKVLGEKNALAYGSTLINLTEKISADLLPFASGLGGNMRQMTKRIRHIAAYRRPTKASRIKSLCIGISAATLLLSLSPALTTYALYPVFTTSSSIEEEVISSDIDLSAYFGDMKGSFVLYDLAEDSWQIYNQKLASARVSPDSTYKIYSALFALDAGQITPEDSEINWDGNIYPFDAWNKKQDLDSAMENSVNWYFQTLEEDMGKAAVQQYIEAIGYGNEDLSGEFPSCWLESSLKISPIEQVYLLKEIFGGQTTSANKFDDFHINAVKKALHLYDIPGGALYGKTGTGNVENHTIRGWFIGFTESNDHTCFFATYLEGSDNASGSRAAEITQSILSNSGVIR